jgi:GNAT superfamily N-acetyltransferase
MENLKVETDKSTFSSVGTFTDYVVTRSGLTVAFFCLHNFDFPPDSNRRFTVLQNLAVYPEHQNQGIGSFALGDINSKIDRRKSLGILLNGIVGRKINLYKNHGWEGIKGYPPVYMVIMTIEEKTDRIIEAAKYSGMKITRKL